MSKTHKKPHILGIFQNKGGVGKTTITTILAEYAAIIEKKNVLIIDLDMQCNTSALWLKIEDNNLPPKHPDYDGDPELNERSSVADIYFGKAVMPYSTYICEENGYSNYVDVMAGHPVLLERINSEFSNDSGKIEEKVINRLKDFLEIADLGDIYDLIILDPAPSKSLIFKSGIRACNSIIIPFESEVKSLQGINAMLQVHQSENYTRSESDKLELIGLCPNKVRLSTNVHKSTLEMLHEKLGKVMFPPDLYLGLSSAIPDRDITGVSPKSIFHISKSHTAYKQSMAIGKYVMNKIFK